MIRRLVPLVALLLAFSVAAHSIEVKHLELNGAHLVQTSAQNYGLISPNLAQYNWKTVSVNGDNAAIWDLKCQATVRSLQTLSESELSLLGQAREQLSAIESPNFPSNGASVYSSTTFSENRSARQSSSSMESSAIQQNGISISKADENNFSVSKHDLPNNLERVFVMNGDSVALVYLDGRVEMKPISCLNADEQQLLEQIRQFVKVAEEKFDQEMKNFKQNMRKSMDNMRNNMNNMFGANPFMNRLFPNQPYNQQQSYDYGQQFQQQQPSYGLLFQQQQPAFGQQFQQQQPGYGQQFQQQQPGFGQQFQQQQPAYNPSGSFGGGYNNYQAPSFNPFGNEFPFGPNNSPFSSGFPFN